MSGPDYLLAIDQGTTSTRAILFDPSGAVLHTARRELRQIYPRPGWDVVKAQLPRSELHDLIVELRSLTLGVGSFARQFDHMAELSGRPAEKVIQTRAQEAAQ